MISVFSVMHQIALYCILYCIVLSGFPDLTLTVEGRAGSYDKGNDYCALATACGVPKSKRQTWILLAITCLFRP